MSFYLQQWYNIAFAIQKNLFNPPPQKKKQIYSQINFPNGVKYKHTFRHATVSIKIK